MFALRPAPFHGLDVPPIPGSSPAEPCAPPPRPAHEPPRANRLDQLGRATRLCAPAEIRRPATEAELVDAGEAGRRPTGNGSRRGRRPLLHLHRLHRRRAGRPRRATAGCSATTPPPAQVTVRGRHPARTGCPTSSTAAASPSRTWATSTASPSPGATQTATHGTGRASATCPRRSSACGSSPPTASVLECSADENADVFDAARVGLGALGVLVDGDAAVRARRSACTPSRSRAASTTCSPTSTSSSTGNDHFEFYWVPHTRWALTKRNRRTDEPARPRRHVPASASTTSPSTTSPSALLCRVGRRRPSPDPAAGARSIPSTGRARLRRTARDRVFTSPRNVRFYEMEYAIPREALPEALNRGAQAGRRASGMRISFPVEVRVTAADDIPLSTAHGPRHRLHRRARVPGHAVRRRTSPASSGSWTPTADGRTGASCTSSGRDRSHRATRAGTTSRRCARRLDPDGRFANPYLDRVLGRPVAVCGGLDRDPGSNGGDTGPLAAKKPSRSLDLA